jgi:hypothetical protein
MVEHRDLKELQAQVVAANNLLPGKLFKAVRKNLSLKNVSGISSFSVMGLHVSSEGHSRCRVSMKVDETEAGHFYGVIRGSSRRRLSELPELATPSLRILLC